MGLRFWRTVTIAPFVRLNLSKGGASVSLGPRGAKVTLGTSGVRYSVGLPGTGVSYGDKLFKKGRGAGKRGGGPSLRGGDGRGRDPKKDLEISFLESLTVSGTEQHFVRGLAALKEERLPDALSELERAPELPDARYMAAVAALRLERYPEARAHLEAALEKDGSLGQLFAQYDFDAEVELPIAEGYAELVGPDAYGATLMLVEVCQRLGDVDAAIGALERLGARMPPSATAALSLAELYMDKVEPEKTLAALTDKTAEEPLLTAIRVYRGRALRALGMPAQALEALVVTSREVKRIPGPLARALRYERALTLEALGRGADARAELQAIYAEDPSYEDVASRLGRG